MNNLILISTVDRKDLCQDITTNLVNLLGQQAQCISLDYEYFTDGSPKILISESVRGKYVTILMDLFNHIPNAGDYSPSVNDKYMTMRGIVKTVKDFGASTIDLIVPSFPYARDDKYDHNGCAETKKKKPNLANLAVSDMIHDGVSNLITLDLHNDATFNRTEQTHFINLSIGRLFQHMIQELGLDSTNVMLSGTDAGGKKKIEAISKDLYINHITTLKERDYTNDQKISKVVVYGDCTDKDIILYDDMIDTGGTIMEAIKEIKSKSPRSIHLLVTHSMLHGNSKQELEKLYEAGIIQSFFTTDSIAHTDLPAFIQVVGLDHLFANTMISLLRNEGVNYNSGNK